MKDRLLRITFYFFIFVFIVLAIDTNNNRNNISYSLVYGELNSISMVSDDHVLPGEKVYLNIDGDVNNIKSISLDLISSRELFTVDVLDISTKPYFILPMLNDNVIANLEYRLDIVKVVYLNDMLDIFSVNGKEDGYKYFRDDSYIIVDDYNGDINAWRDFNNIIILNNKIDEMGYVYIKLNADTKEMVNIVFNLIDKDNNSFSTSIENIDTRSYINMSGASVGEYSIESIIIYYRDGISVKYGTNYDDDIYLDIENNSIIVDKFIDLYDTKNIEEIEKVNNKDSSTQVKDIKDYIWIVVLVLLIIGALILFYYLKTEDDND